MHLAILFYLVIRIVPHTLAARVPLVLEPSTLVDSVYSVLSCGGGAGPAKRRQRKKQNIFSLAHGLTSCFFSCDCCHFPFRFLRER